MVIHLLQKAAVWTAVVFFALVWLLCIVTVGWQSALVALVLLAVLWGLGRGIARLQPCTADRLFWLAFCVFVLAAGAFAFAGKVEPAWDFGRVYHGALEITTSGSIQIDSQYFLESNNNFFLALLLAPVFIAGSLAGFSSLTSGILFNLLAIDASILMLWRVAHRQWGAQRALAVAVGCFGCAGLWLYGPIFYTDTLSMPLACLALLLAQQWNRVTGGTRLLLAAGMGVTAFVGYRIKPTVLIVFVALVLWWLLSSRRGIAAACTGAVVFALLMGLWSVILAHNPILDTTELERYRLPPMHYVMMGLKNPGGYDEQDHMASQALPSAEARTQHAVQEIKARLQAYGPAGLADHIARKLAYTWADGSYFGGHKLSIDPVNQGWLQQWVTPQGSYWQIFILIANAQQLVVCTGLSAAAIGQARSKQCSGLVWTVLIALLGAGVFLLLWETRSRYLVGLLPLILLAAQQGLEQLLHLKAAKKNLVN